MKVCTKQHSHVANTLQEVTDEALVLAAEILLECGLHPVLDVTHFDPAGVPAYRQVPQRRAQNKVVPL